MTDTTEAKAPEISWDSVVPKFGSQFRPPALPERPSDGAIRMAQRSYDGVPESDAEDAEILHVITHRFKTIEQADAAADELKRAGAYTTPASTVTVIRDPEGTGDNHVVRWRAGEKRGRKS